MQISACIICKNEEQYIGKCIQALRAFPVHIVVADTGSTDNTLSILEKLHMAAGIFYEYVHGVL